MTSIFKRGRGAESYLKLSWQFALKTNLPKLLDLPIFCIHSLNLSLEFLIMIFFVTNQLNISKFLPPQIRKNMNFLLQRVPALRVFWDLEKTVLHETHVSGTVLWSPTNANSPTYTYISQKTC